METVTIYPTIAASDNTKRHTLHIHPLLVSMATSASLHLDPYVTWQLPLQGAKDHCLYRLITVLWQRHLCNDNITAHSIFIMVQKAASLATIPSYT